MKEMHEKAPERLLDLGNGYTRVYYNTTEVAREDGVCFESNYIDISGVLHNDKIVDALIRERYPLSEELAIQRQRDIKKSEFDEYYKYCEECKKAAREVCGISEN